MTSKKKLKIVTLKDWLKLTSIGSQTPEMKRIMKELTTPVLPASEFPTWDGPVKAKTLKELAKHLRAGGSRRHAIIKILTQKNAILESLPGVPVFGPLTIRVSGPQGSGKSTMVAFLRRSVKRRFPVCEVEIKDVQVRSKRRKK